MKILILIFGITLFGCSWTSKTEKKLTVSENDTSKYAKKIESEIIENNIDSTLTFNQQKLGERQLFTGGLKTDSGKTKTNGIYVNKIADNEIEYSYTQLINWKKEFEKDGIAELISTTDSILTVKNLKEPAYKFVDAKSNIVIYVTKNDRVNETRAKVFNEKGEQISALMYNK